MRIPVLKDADGDYWLSDPSGDLTCLNREGLINGATSPDMLAVSDYGPITTVTLEIRELPDPALTCDACLNDLHFCYQCDDAVEHGHRHEED